MDKTISLFVNLRVNEVMDATGINEYCKRNLLEETIDLHGLWAVTLANAWRDIYGCSS